MTYTTKEIAISDDSQWVVHEQGAMPLNMPPGAYEDQAEATALTLYMPDFRRDALFHEVLRQMQQGAWQQAIFLLETLKSQYPQAREVDALLQDAHLRVALEQSWGSKVQAKRSMVAPWRVVGRILAVGALFVLLFMGFRYFEQMQRVYALNSERQALLEQAAAAMEDSRFEEALQLYGQLLLLDPTNTVAQQGQLEAQNQLGLAIEYSAGVDAMQNGNAAEAMQRFLAIQNKAPGYRDVAQLLEQLKGSLQVQEVFAAAESAYQNAEWDKAIAQYETLRSLDSNYEAATVADHLFAAYLAAGQALVKLSPEGGVDLNVAQDYFRKSLKLKVSEPTAKGESELLDSYFLGKQGADQGDVPTTIKHWLIIYQQRPQYLNGYIAQQLYLGYLELGKRSAQNNDYLAALDFFSQALNLQVADTSEAAQLVNQMTILLTPTATPEPTPVPLPTATPTPLSIYMFQGWIVFQSEREAGKGLYMMRPDGSEQQAAPDDTADLLAQFYDKELWSPDGNSRLYAAKPENSTGDDVNIYKRREDLPADWTRDFRLTDFSALSYDPVWSPNNHWIAFVSTKSGNDEIWIMNTEGQNQQQLTFNSWEWDKHPTWSPDGSQLAFYSNRTGKRQIFIMNPDGSNQVNISNNQYDDWNPVWIK